MFACGWEGLGTRLHSLCTEVCLMVHKIFSVLEYYNTVEPLLSGQNETKSLSVTDNNNNTFVKLIIFIPNNNFLVSSLYESKHTSNA